MAETMKKAGITRRRTFLKSTGAAVIGGTLAYNMGIVGAMAAGSSNTLKVGLIGCGGRGTGAAAQALRADPDVVLTAMGDVFADRLEQSLKALAEEVPAEKLKVSRDHRFIGFDAYRKVIDSGVDVVLLTTPPRFRPEHMMAAVEAGKHVFCEKPVAVDAPGVRKVLAAAKKAKEKNLSVVSGFCYRYDYGYRAMFDKILNGEIGELMAVTTMRYGTELWSFPRQPGWTDMEYKMRNWYYYHWLSGDHIVEQAVHSIDLMCWVMGDQVPVRATGSGGRQVRTDPIFGNIYDHFAIEYEYANGARGYHFCRQHNNCTNRNTIEMFGSKGLARIRMGKPVLELSGKGNWTYNGEKNDMYQTEHDELFASIRNGRPVNDGKWMANSTMMAIMGRDSAYTGKTVTWADAINSEKTEGPPHEQFSWDLEWDGPGVPVPGKDVWVRK
jgi:predicted dehydrogenase